MVPGANIGARFGSEASRGAVGMAAPLRIAVVIVLVIGIPAILCDTSGSYAFHGFGARPCCPSAGSSAMTYGRFIPVAPTPMVPMRVAPFRQMPMAYPAMTQPAMPFPGTPMAMPPAPMTPDQLAQAPTAQQAPSVPAVPAWKLGLAPPPGTLGRTYLRPTRAIPYDKHPRTTMLEVSLPKGIAIDKAAGQSIKVTVQDIDSRFKELDGYLGTDGVWHFESKPVYPGIPHIYDVEFEIIRTYMTTETRHGRTFEVPVEEKVSDLGFRRVRLIPGRIVKLDFHDVLPQRYVLPYPPYTPVPTVGGQMPAHP